VPNNIVRPTYLDLITNRFIATSLRLVSAEKFDLDPSAEKSYFCIPRIDPRGGLVCVVVLYVCVCVCVIPEFYCFNKIL
jgi:hypothetical protein